MDGGFVPSSVRTNEYETISSAHFHMAFGLERKCLYIKLCTHNIPFVMQQDDNSINGKVAELL